MQFVLKGKGGKWGKDLFYKQRGKRGGLGRKLQSVGPQVSSLPTRLPPHTG